MTIEDELRQSLRRQQAPADLAERVLASVAATRRSQPAASSFAHGARRWLAAAALLVISAGAAERYYTHKQQAEEAARLQAEIRIALQITNNALAHVQSKLSAPAEKKNR